MQIDEIIVKLDELFSENKGQEAQKLLENSIKVAVANEDDNALLTLLNEMIGFLRETSQMEGAYSYVQTTLKLMEKMNIKGSLAYATTLLNIANAYRAGGRLQESLSYYEEVLAIYKELVEENDMLFASLYNNISLLYQELGEFVSAKENLLLALVIVKRNQDAEFEEAVTYANIASTCLTLDEDEEALSYCSKALSLFEAQGIRDAHYCAALSSMGTYYYKKQAYEQAASYFRQAMAGMKEALGENEYYHRLSENLEACKRAMNQLPQSGLDLCREYYETYGKPMICEQFAEYRDQIAAGLCGEGSDCFGFDDEISRDHDWGPGFAMWVSKEVYAQIGVALQDAYEKLPKEFKGFTRKESSQGSNRVGVTTIAGFYHRLLGKENINNLSKDFKATDVSWAQISDEALAAAVNGEVFTDQEGIFSAIRTVLQKGFPERIFYLKIAEACAKFSQSAQYNYGRMLGRGDRVAAELSLIEGMKQAMKLLYYLEKEYPPHDKWLYKGLTNKPEYIRETQLLNKLIEKENIPEHVQIMEELAGLLCARLYKKDVISLREVYLEFHVTELLQKSALAQMKDAELVDEIAKAEFEAFDKVRNAGGRASCQNDWPTFQIMRKSQYMTWNRSMLIQYLYEFNDKYHKGHNLIEEKYGRMMKSTAPEEYAKIADQFPVIPGSKKEIIENIVQIQVGFMEEFSKQYPGLAHNARLIHTKEDQYDDTSYETYLRGEISTYSDKMLELYGRFIVDICKKGLNISTLTMQNSVHLYGYSDLEEAQRAAEG